MSEEELLEEIRPDMRLTWDFFKRIYGYSVTDPDFAEQVINALRAAGCSHAGEYYGAWLESYKKEHDAMLKNVAAWLRDGKDGWIKECVKKRPEDVRDQVKHMDPEELKTLCRQLLKDGVIKDPEELVTFVFGKEGGEKIGGG